MIGIRIGPFYTTGGYEWSGLAATVNSSFLKPYRGELYAFRQWAMGSMDTDNALLPFPPIHQHHFHFAGGLTSEPDDINVHADSQCHAAEGGVDCLSHRAPDGFAWILADRLWLIHEFNDARSNHSGYLETWTFLSMEFINQQERVVQVRQIIIAFQPNYFNPTVVAPRNQYLIWTHVESVGWTHSAMQSTTVRAQVIEVYMHGHGKAIEDMWLFEGGPSEVFKEPSRAKFALDVTRYGQHAVSSIAMNIKERQVLPRRGHLVCSYKESSRIEALCTPNFCDDAMYRRARCAIINISHHYVLVVFHKAQRNPSGVAQTYSNGLPLYRNHAGVRFYYAISDGKAVVAKDNGLTLQQRATALMYPGDIDRVPYYWKTILPEMQNVSIA
jgi:hypothetical protein